MVGKSDREGHGKIARGHDEDEPAPLRHGDGRRISSPAEYFSETRGLRQRLRHGPGCSRGNCGLFLPRRRRGPHRGKPPRGPPRCQHARGNFQDGGIVRRRRATTPTGGRSGRNERKTGLAGMDQKVFRREGGPSEHPGPAAQRTRRSIGRCSPTPRVPERGPAAIGGAVGHIFLRQWNRPARRAQHDRRQLEERIPRCHEQRGEANNGPPRRRTCF
mmetsp:Transcript_3732/g.7796  ORF Transcript_3732/g.7796 Transcript_3732/m.7796 type:complete len:217 (-) Transcript_3732:81-731(-)